MEVHTKSHKENLLEKPQKRNQEISTVKTQ